MFFFSLNFEGHSGTFFFAKRQGTRRPTHFSPSPFVLFEASVAGNTYVVAGQAEAKRLEEPETMLLVLFFVGQTDHFWAWLRRILRLFCFRAHRPIPGVAPEDSPPLFFLGHIDQFQAWLRRIFSVPASGKHRPIWALNSVPELDLAVGCWDPFLV